jgi:hypothetical protein
MSTKLRYPLIALALLAGLAALMAPAAALTACPFCVDERGPTLVEDYAQASMVLYGSFTNPRLDAGGGVDNGTSDFVIEKTLKSHEILKGKNVITLAKYIPASKSKYIIFCDVYKNNVNPYRGEEVTPGSELLKYLTSALEFKDEPIGKRLRHCFDFLNSTDLVVSTDAYREFAKADYADYKALAKTLPATTIAGWLEDPKTPTYRLGLYASLLGHCGDPKIHGALLRTMIEDPKHRQSSSVSGIMAGYVLLQPEEGWKYVQKLLKSDSEEFYVRYYAGLGTLKFYWDNRSDVLTKDKIIAGMSQAMELQDMADFAIDDLRVWQAWDLTDRVLELFAKKSHDNPIVRRAILRFALSSPSPRAKAFVAVQRQRDPTWVSDTEELLRIDTPAPKTPAGKGNR